MVCLKEGILMNRDVRSIPRSFLIETTIGKVGGKWKALILDHLADGALRFGELQKQMPKITPKMLTQQLRELETDGIISRRVYPVVPPKVEYELTEFGKTVTPLLDAMCVWGQMYLESVRNREESTQ